MGAFVGAAVGAGIGAAVVHAVVGVIVVVGCVKVVADCLFKKEEPQKRLKND